jgi:cell division protein FtsL
MLAELAMITSALGTVNAAVAQFKQSKATAEDIGDLIAKFSTQTTKLDAAERKHKLKKPLTPAQSTKLVLARRASAQSMRDLKDLCLMAGVPDVWRETEKAIRDADRQQKEFLRDIQAKRKTRNERVQGIAIAVTIFVTVLGILSGGYVVYQGYQKAQYIKNRTHIERLRDERRNIRKCGHKKC